MLGVLVWFAAGCVSNPGGSDPASVPAPEPVPPSDHSRTQAEVLEGIVEAAPASQAGLIQVALDLIKTFEDWVPKPYDDPAGFCTIGHGHLIAKDACKKVLPRDGFVDGVEISEEQGEIILKKDLGTAEAAVNELVKVELKAHEFGALTSFTFNVGRKNLANSTLLRVLNRGDRDAAANEFPRWAKAGGKVLKGLQRRRRCERALFADELVLGEGDVFDRTTCQDEVGLTSKGPLIDLDVGEGAPQ